MRSAFRTALHLESLERREMLHGDDVFPTITIETQLGDITIELLDEIAPRTVENFLNYVHDNDFEDMFFHRSARRADGSPFVIQGGGFTSSSAAICGDPCDVSSIDNSVIDTVPTDPPVMNEPGLSNVRGTVSMAKNSDPNSATSQFFVSLNDNSFLDSPGNGAFTVFGRVPDLAAADAIVDLPAVDMRSAFLNRPFVNAMGEVPVFANNQGESELVQTQNITGTTVVHGTVYNDFNGDGQIDVGEGGMFRRTVFIDSNGNGMHEESETSTMTNARGEFHFVMPAGTHRVRLLDGTDYAQTITAPGGERVETLAIGESARGLDFGMQYVGSSWQNPLINTDVDGVNGTTPIDALTIITELDAREYSNRDNGMLFPLTGTPERPLFLDVVGNNAVGPLDANLVINNLITTAEPQAVPAAPANLAVSPTPAETPPEQASVPALVAPMSLAATPTVERSLTEVELTAPSPSAPTVERLTLPARSAATSTGSSKLRDVQTEDANEYGAPDEFFATLGTLG